MSHHATPNPNTLAVGSTSHSDSNHPTYIPPGVCHTIHCFNNRQFETQRTDGLSPYPLTCSLLGGPHQGSGSRTRGVRVLTSCAVESVQLLVVKRGTKTRDDGGETRDNGNENTEQRWKTRDNNGKHGTTWETRDNNGKHGTTMGNTGQQWEMWDDDGKHGTRTTSCGTAEREE